MSTPDIGVFLPSMGDAHELPGDMATTARHAEELGFESAWVVDQLVAGNGTPLLDSAIALAVAATATERIRLGFGVLIVPLRPVVWIAKQVGSLQLVSGNRIILGVGVGGDRHDRSWDAAGVPQRERGRRTDAALRVLPDLLAGQPTRLEDEAGQPVVGLSPPAAMPPIVVGGMSDAAVRRTVDHGASWFLAPGQPADLKPARDRLVEAAEARGRPVPTLTASMMTAITGDPALPDRDGLVQRLIDPDGRYGMPVAAVDDLLTTGDAGAIAERLSAFGDAGAQRIIVSIAAGDWMRQAELLAEARDSLR